MLVIDQSGEHHAVQIGQIVSFIHHVVYISCEAAASSTPTSIKNHILVHTHMYNGWGTIHVEFVFIHQFLVSSTVLDHESTASFMPMSRTMCRYALSPSVPLSLSFDYEFLFVFLY